MKSQDFKIFRRNKKKDLLFLILFSIFTWLAFYSQKEFNFKSLIGIVFFGIGAILFLFQLITNYSYLKLKKEGFEQRTLLRVRFFNWSDIENFEINNFRGNRSISFYHKIKNEKSQRKSISISYTIKTRELVDLMNKYKVKENNNKITELEREKSGN